MLRSRSTSLIDAGYFIPQQLGATFLLLVVFFSRSASLAIPAVCFKEVSLFGLAFLAVTVTANKRNKNREAGRTIRRALSIDNFTFLSGKEFFLFYVKIKAYSRGPIIINNEEVH
jgi:hypothetical protein